MLMEWIPRDVIHPSLPEDGYVDVLVNLKTPSGMKTTVMTYFSPEEKCFDKHLFVVDDPQSWSDNFTHYCLFPEPLTHPKT